MTFCYHQSSERRNALAGHESSSKAILYALIANMGIAIAKAVGYFLTGSGTMLAETVHSLADCTNQLLLFLGLRRAKKPPTENHPLGFGKVIYFWSFIVAILLFSVGGLFSIYEGAHKLAEAESGKAMDNPLIALGILLFGIILEGLSTLGALREVKKLRRDKSFKEWTKNTRKAELLVILGEDIGAVLGMALAFVFVLLAWITGNMIYDAIGSMCIGVVLILISVFLTIRVKSLLVGRSADPDIEDMIESEIKAQPGIEKLFNVITMQFGPDVMLAAKVKMKKDLSIEKASQLINDLENKIKLEFPEVTWLFIEPDIKD